VSDDARPEHRIVRVRDAARDPVVSCDTADDRVAIFERGNSATYLRGYTVEVRR